MASSTPFKVPSHLETPNSKSQLTRNGTQYFTPKSHIYRSDSNESISSTPSENGQKLSLAADYDELIRAVTTQQLEHSILEKSYLHFCEETKLMFGSFKTTREECFRLKERLDLLAYDKSDLETKLQMAKLLLDQEKKKTRAIQRERDQLEMQLMCVKNLLYKENEKGMVDDINANIYGRNGLGGSVISNDTDKPFLSAIPEINSTGSLLSDYSYTKSEDDLDSSKIGSGKEWKKHRISDVLPEPAQKKRRSSQHQFVEISNADTVRATTTLTVNKCGPITATSIIESVPKPETPARSFSKYTEASTLVMPTAPPANLVFQSWGKNTPNERNNNTGQRPHTFEQKIIVRPETCAGCNKRLGFGRSSLKCKDCKSHIHVDCKSRLPLPCIPQVSTPERHILGVIGDFTPTTSPMVPSLIVHCIQEIELRGLTEIGLYRIPGSEKDVRYLKEKFLKGKGIPCINNTDVHVMCGTVKSFLRSLREPLITYGLWKSFMKIIEYKNDQDVASGLYQLISELPQPNRDTLAYIMAHLQRVAQSKDCKMPIENLSKVFAPTLVGYSCDEPVQDRFKIETSLQVKLMEKLLELPNTYWESFINVNTQVHYKLQQTPSTDSLFQRGTVKSCFTPGRTTTPKRKRFFPTPP